MQTYIKIIGVIGSIILLVLSGIVITIALGELGKGQYNEAFLILLMLIPIYVLSHFLIAYKFGFNSDVKHPNSNILIIGSVLTFLVVLTPHIIGIVKQAEENSLSDLKDLGTDSAAYDYYGNLKVKYIENQLHYKAEIFSKGKFNAKRAKEFYSIKLLDFDGFLISKLELKDRERITSNNETIGASFESKSDFNLNDYNRIGQWKLEVNSEDNVMEMYLTLRKDGFKLPDNIDDFRKDVADKAKCRMLYNALIEDGYEVLADFEAFYRDVNPNNPLDY